MVGSVTRTARGQLDRIEQEALPFFERTRARYLELAAQDKTIVTVDAAQPLELVTARSAAVRPLAAAAGRRIMNWYPWLNGPYRQLVGQYADGRGHHALLLHAQRAVTTRWPTA